MNLSSDESRYIAPTYAYPQGGPSSHAANEQPDHHPATTNPNTEQSPYHAGDSGTSSDMNDYRHHQLTGSNHDHPNLEPYPSPLINGQWLSNDMRQPASPFPGGVSQGVMSDGSNHSNQTGIPNWGYQYQFDHERGGEPTSSSLPYPAQPPPNQPWLIESGMLGPASNGDLASFSPTAAHSAQPQTTQWMYAHPPAPQTYPAIGYSGSQPPIPRNATATTPYIDDIPPNSSNGSPSLPGDNLDRFRAPNAPQSNPFSSFPAGDSSRDLNYHQSSDYGQRTNDLLLGVRAPSSHSDSGSTHPHHPPTIVAELGIPFLPTSNSTSATQFRQTESARRSEEEAAQEKYFKTCFPNDPELQKSALDLSKKDWLRSNQAEPPLDSESGQPLGAPASRFDVFFEANGNHRCLFLDNGKRCSHTAPRKERALGHARGHFDYKPFYCESRCGKANCTHKYHCQSALKDHIRRRGNPERACEICGRQISAQNIRRHRNTHGAKAQPEMPTSPPQDGPPKRSKFKRVVTSIGKAIKRTLSRSPSPPK